MIKSLNLTTSAHSFCKIKHVNEICNSYFKQKAKIQDIEGRSGGSTVRLKKLPSL